ncbi:MAG: tetratricopeptide repeat protein [Deltaproteobacteria bacterium]|nr:tetratricopeptide repeat protein [Deltaproteobacteria bacterium]
MHVTATPGGAAGGGLTSWPALRGARGSARARVLAAVGALAVVGALVVLYLPLSSLRDGPIDWGDPQTLGRLRDHLSARAIREAYLHRILVPWRFTEDLATAARTLVEDLGAPFVLLAVAGMLVAARRRAAWPVLAATLVDLVYAVTVNPMGTPDRQTLFVTEAGMAVLGVLALGALIERLAGRVRWEVSLAVVFAIAVGTLARYDRRWAGSADRWAATEVLGGAGALGSLPARAVVLCNSDDTCGGAMFAQWVEGERPDVTVLPPRFLGDASTWRRLTAHRSLLRRPQAAPARGSIDEWRLRWLIAHARDRVRWEGDGIDVPWLTLSPGETPLLARVGAAEAADAAVDRDASRWVLPRVPGDGVGARYVGAMVLFSAGVREARGDLSRGAPLWRAALTVSPEHAGAWRNLAVIEARSGHLAEAVAMTRRSLDLQPDRPRAWRNLAEYLAASGDRAGAAEARREAARR